ncbi:MAG: hypothetical protein H6510_03855 [Acidobacteria bacterium]|nr:hypothetical protein [Acidobacteriota bacterium]MCB9396929.1 hypothetical protein [Acidobacteriota bacterium]
MNLPLDRRKIGLDLQDWCLTEKNPAVGLGFVKNENGVLWQWHKPFGSCHLDPNIQPIRDVLTNLLDGSADLSTLLAVTQHLIFQESLSRKERFHQETTAFSELFTQTPPGLQAFLNKNPRPFGLTVQQAQVVSTLLEWLANP